MGKGILEVEIALGLFFLFFFGGTPWKRESGDFRLLWDYFFCGNPWNKESGDLRLLWDYFLFFDEKW